MRLHNAYSKMYTKLFESLKKLTDLDLQRICVNMESNQFWEDCNRFLVDRGYVRAKNLTQLKEDQTSLINLYKLHAVHFCTSQLLLLSNKIRFVTKRQKDDIGDSDQEDKGAQKNDDQSEESDYRDDDF